MQNGFWKVKQRCETLTPSNFAYVPAMVRPLAIGEILVRTLYVSLDPYLARAMRTWSGEVPEWHDGTIHGRLIGEVIQSRLPGFDVGARVLAIGRWQPLQAIPADRAEKLAGTQTGSGLALGVLGRSGLTAWVGLHLAELCSPETVMVSAATGPVGSVVAQLSRSRGCRVIGIAGGESKCAHAVSRLGYDICLDHRAPGLAERISQAAPDGIDLLFENVGQTSLDAALPAMRHGGRIILAGLAQHYNDAAPISLHHFKELLYRAITVRGFITAEHRHLFDQALDEIEQGINSGAIVYDETIIDGLEHAPTAYVEMLGGEGLGKRMIRLSL